MAPIFTRQKWEVGIEAAFPPWLAMPNADDFLLGPGIHTWKFRLTDVEVAAVAAAVGAAEVGSAGHRH